MLTNLIEYRGKEFSNLIKIGDYLARSLRENVELFYVEDGIATYLTESGSVISGKYSFKPTLKLSKIIVEDASVLDDRKAFEKMADKKVMSMLSNLLEDDYQNAESSFDKILSMFETKLSYERIKNRLIEKTQRFGDQTKIIESEQFSRLIEVKDQIIKFIKESDEVLSSPKIKNAIKLATLVSTSFDLPKTSIEQLAERKEFSVKFSGKSSLYEYLCRKELIQKELLEAKESFDNIWVTSPLIQDLASMIYESDEEVVRHQVAQIISDIPYFSLATKKQITSLLKNSLSLSETKITSTDINTFAGIIFEMKKPVKKYVLNVLNEKYGIDVTKLSEVPTFRNLLLTESEILSHISDLAPKGSVVKTTLKELSTSLKLKNGAEAIDVADFLSEIFVEAGGVKALNETSLMDYMDFTKVAEDLGKIGQVLKMLVPAVQQAADSVEGHGEDMAQPEDEVESSYEEEPQDPLGSPDPMDSGSEAPAMDAETAAEEVKDEEEAGDGSEMPMDAEEEEMSDEDSEESFDDEEAPEEMEQDDLTALLSKIEDLLAGIASDDEEEGSDEEDVDMPEDLEDSEEEDEEDSEEEDYKRKKSKKLDPEQYKS